MGREGEEQRPDLRRGQAAIQVLDRSSQLGDRQPPILIFVEKVEQILNGEADQLVHQLLENALDPSRADATLFAQAHVEAVEEPVVVHGASVWRHRFLNAEQLADGIPRDGLAQHRHANFLPHAELHEAASGRRRASHAEVLLPQGLPQFLLVRDDQLRNDPQDFVFDLLAIGVVGFDGKVGRRLGLSCRGTPRDLPLLPSVVVLRKKLRIDLPFEQLLRRLGRILGGLGQVRCIVHLWPDRARKIPCGQFRGGDDKHRPAVVLDALVVGGAEDGAQAVVVVERKPVATRRHLMGPDNEPDELALAKLEGNVRPEAHEAAATRGDLLAILLLGV
mmetsp:Transcript_56735/g.164563  ORF Transcript_56735/g.164563 Transcript_56735/m.164563 type:complete len:334 (-) Transcript_56735:1118-2119(-)